MTRSTFEDF